MSDVNEVIQKMVSQESTAESLMVLTKENQVGLKRMGYRFLEGVQCFTAKFDQKPFGQWFRKVAPSTHLPSPQFGEEREDIKHQPRVRLTILILRRIDSSR